MLVTIGSVYSVHVKVPPVDMPDRLTLMGSWPTVYGPDLSPLDRSDYTLVVYAKGERNSVSDVIDMMRQYGATSARWLTDFYREV